MPVPTVHRESGFRFVIFVDDHEPAHVHAFGAGAAKINLTGAGGAPELVHAVDMKAGDLRTAMRIVGERQGDMIARWRELHG